MPVKVPGFAALLAGAVGLGDDWPAAAEVIACASDGLRGAAMALRPWIDGMAGLVDERRQILGVAGHLVVVIEGLLAEEDQAEA